MAQPKTTRPRAPRAPASAAEDEGAEPATVVSGNRLKAARASPVEADVRVPAAVAPSLLSSESRAMVDAVKRTGGGTAVLLKARTPSTRHAAVRASLASLRRMI